MNQNIQYKRLNEIIHDKLILENWYFETFYPSFKMDYHLHPQIELMYCAEGSFDFYYKQDENDKNISKVTINKNCIIIINTGYYHKIANVDYSTKILNLEFIPTSKKKASNNLETMVNSVSITLSQLMELNQRLKKFIRSNRNFYILIDDNNVLSLMETIIKEATREDSPERTFKLGLLTTQLFVDLAKCSFSEGYNKTGIHYVDAATTYINSRFMNRINIDEISQYVKVSNVYLQKLFKLQYGKTIHAFINEKRLNQAKYLLLNSSLTNSEISKSCGFGNREQFVTLFKKNVGVTPKEFKRNNANKTIRYFSHKGEIEIKDN